MLTLRARQDGRVLTYIAFLRAINLGAKRRFPKEAIKAAVESVGATGVETYINTGNVRLDIDLPQNEVMSVLEAAFLADRGFEVPTVVLTPAELRTVAADADSVHVGLGPHYVCLLRQPPGTAAAARGDALSTPACVVRVVGRAAHLMRMEGTAFESVPTTPVLDRTVGIGTSRNLTVVRALVQKWE